jgi:hypothetical protein
LCCFVAILRFDYLPFFSIFDFSEYPLNKKVEQVSKEKTEDQTLILMTSQKKKEKKRRVPVSGSLSIEVFSASFSLFK